MYACMNKDLTTLPKTVPNGTNWLDFKGNKFRHLKSAYNYKSIVHIDISFGNISSISDKAMKVLLNNTRLLNIRNNSLTYLLETIRDYAKPSTDLWMGNNPYECHCDMMWMKDWLLGTEKVLD